METFFSELWSVMIALAPWLLLGAVIAGVLQVLVPDAWLGRALAGRAGVFKAVAFGVPLPLCSCGVIPAGVSLKQRGASDGAALGFMISTPQTGVDSILVSAGMLGWPFALFKVGAAALLGIVGGLASSTEASPPRRAAQEGHGHSWRAGAEHSLEVIRSVWGWLAFGVIISAALGAFIPTDKLAAVAEAAGPWSLVAVLLLSVPLYVCATASVPIAAALVAGGFPPGAALVFLMAGPATNVATIGAVARTFGRKSLVIYLTTIIVGSVALGWAFDSVLASAASMPMHDHSQANWLETASAIVLTAMLVWFAIDDLRARFRKPAPEGAAMREYTVEGMTCQGCVRKLERSLDGGGIAGYEVSLDAGLLRVASEVPPARVEALVNEAGYRIPHPAP